MADDGGAASSRYTTEDAIAQERRGPMRPGRLQSVRKRLAGASIARLFQFGDVLGLSIAAMLVGWWAGFAQPILIAAPLLTLILMLLVGGYRMGTREVAWRRYAQILAASFGAALSAEGLGRLLTSEPPLRVGLTWAIAASATLVALHLLWTMCLARLRRRGFLTPNIIIIGATVAAERLIEAALQRRDVNILGIFDDRRDRVGPSVHGVPVLGSALDLLDHRVLPFIDRIVITVPEKASDRIAQLVRQLAPIPNPIVLLFDGDDPVFEAKAMGRITDFGLAQIFGTPKRTGYQVAKRAVDLTLSLAAAAALAPLFAMIAAAIRLDSPGPIFFRQRRYGYLNEEIRVWKFRSMRADAEDPTAFRQVSAGDDRVTRVGGFLRKTSLDELPQIFNVVRGEMSLVGPRPHAIGMLTGGADASKLVESYAHRHRIRPGLTGWAAVNGSRGPVDTPEAVRHRVALDLQYVEHQSLWLDLAIMLRTVPCLLGDSVAVR